MTIILILINMAMMWNGMGQGEAWKAAGMEAICIREAAAIRVELTSPGQGWMAIGFNEREGLAGADLKMLAVADGSVVASDRFIVAPGDHRPDESLGGMNHIEVVDWKQDAGGTKIVFRIPAFTGHSTDFDFREPRQIWVTLAWSVSPDWSHHSRQRETLKVWW